MESSNGELCVWQIMNSGHKIIERPLREVAFLDKADLKVEFFSISNRIATLTLQEETLLGCYASTKTSEDSKKKESFRRKVAKTFRSMSGQSQQVIVLGDFNCKIKLEAKELGDKLVHLLLERLKMG